MTYKLSTNDVPILGIVLVVCVLHQIVILENRNPIFFVRHVLASIAGTGWCDELFYGYCVSVEILQRQVAKE